MRAWKRGMALFLVGVMSFTFLNIGPLTMEAEAVTVGARFTFENGSSFGELIAGDSADVKSTDSTGKYKIESVKVKKLKGKDRDGNTRDFNDNASLAQAQNLISFALNQNKPESEKYLFGRVSVGKDWMGTPFADFNELTFTMRANYYVSGNGGLFTETVGGSGVTGGSFTIEGSDIISSNSSLSLKYMGDGSFQMVGAPPVGIFDQDFTDFFVENWTNEGGYAKMRVRLVGPSTRYIELVSKQKIPIIDNQGTIEPNNHKWIASGTNYLFSFEPEESNTEIALTAYSPQGIVNAIRDAIETPNTMSEYIIFKNGDTAQSIATEGPNAIDLLGYYKKYKNQNITLEWEWVPQPLSQMSTEDQAKHKDHDHKTVITSLNTPTNINNEWMHATVLPENDQIQGEFKAKITYFDSAGNPAATVDGANRATVGIKILGKGVPPEMTVTGMTIGASQVTSANRVPANMDAYQDDIPQVPKMTGMPYAFNGELRMGTKNKECQKVKIALSNPAALKIEYKASGSSDEYQEYKQGTDLSNPGASGDQENPGAYLYIITANPLDDEQKKTGIVTDMTVSFTRNNQIYKETKYTITIIDSSPSRNNALVSMEGTIFESDTPILGGLFGGSRKLTAADGFDFKPDTIEYPKVEVPYNYNKITFKLVRGQSGQKMWMNVDYSAQNIEIKNGRATEPIELAEGVPRKVVVSVQSESLDIRKYNLTIERMFPSDDSYLQVLEAFDSDEKDAKPLALDPAFAKDKPEYTLSVPYATDRILVHAKMNFPTATLSINGNTAKIGEDSRWIKLRCDLENGVVVPGGNVTTIQIATVAEDPNANQGTYTLKVTREAPSKDATLSKLDIAPYEKGEAQAKPPLAMTPAFAPAGEAFAVSISYATKQLKVTATPTIATSKIERLNGGKVVETLKSGVPSKAITDIDFSTEEKPYYEIPIRVTAEDGYTQQTYLIQVQKAPPSDDPSLVSLVVTGDDAKVVELDPAFDTETTSYIGSVPYSVKKVTVTATAAFPEGSKITVNGKKAVSGEASPAIKLADPGDATTIEVHIVAENENFNMTYRIQIRREKPGSDARLQALSAAPIVEDSWKPIFIPNVTDYTAVVPLGQTAGVNITATANDPKATIKIDGKKAVSGQPYGPIILMEVEQTIEIVVTAEDGESTMTYRITFTDQNKITYTDNVDLDNIKVKPGVMEPVFDASVTDYKVYEKEDVTSVQIIPTPADPLAKVQVFLGTKEIGDYDSNYVSAINDGANVFKITVTSAKPDSKKTKDYTVTVYRNDPENMGILKPLMADDINWDTSGNIINVDITKYTRVSAEVFNTLRDDYPEKTIVFQGNDYSLSFKGSDLDTIVPQQQVFDFKMSFTSPEEGAIDSLIDRYRENASARVVMVYFDHHGALPATATLTLSLGHRYRNNTLYWHYYNTERDRIDYYGQVQSNSQGTFAVPIDHLSTYLAADIRLAGSENKEGGVIINPNLSEQTSATKINPDTGEWKKEGD